MSTDHQKPEWFAKHEKSDLEHFGELAGQIKEIKDMLEPVVETYRTVVRLGRWGKVALGILLLLLSIAVAARNLLK